MNNKVEIEKLSAAVRNAEYYENQNYCGSESYHKVSPFGLVATDGALHVYEELKCFWIADIIASYIPELRKGEGFYVVHIVVNESKADVYIDDGNYNIIVHQEIPYTDLKQNVKLYVSNEGKYFVSLLPSEY